MPQLSLYLNDVEMNTLRERAGREGASLSSYAREILNRDASKWPKGFWDLYGALQDDSFVVPEDLDESHDRPIPSFD